VLFLLFSKPNACHAPARSFCGFYSKRRSICRKVFKTKYICYTWNFDKNENTVLSIMLKKFLLFKGIDMRIEAAEKIG
jgi:hypothetical protein